MNPITPRFRLPDQWTGHGTCPVCRTRGRLVVVHQAIIPDHFRCGVCEAAFEVEQGGDHIRLVHLPVRLDPARSALLGAWLLPPDLPALIASAFSTTAAPEPDLPHAPEVSPAPTRPLADETPATLASSAPPVLSDEAALGSESANRGETVELSPHQLHTAPDDSSASPAGALEQAEAFPAALSSAGLLAQLDDVGPRPSGDVAAVTQLLLDLVPDAAAPDVPAPEAPPLPAPEIVAEAVPDLSQTIHDLLYAEAELAGGDGIAAPEPLRADAPVEPAAGPAPETRPPEPTEASPAAAPATPDLAGRARQLYDLGNPLPLIRAALERSGAPPDQVAAALAGIQAQEDQRRQRHRRAFVLVGGGGLLLVTLIVLGAWIVSSARPAAPTDPAVLSATVGPTITPGGPTLTPTRRYSLLVDLINSVIPGDVKLANGPSPTPGPTSEIYATLFPPTATLEPAAAQATADARATQGLPPDDLPDWARDLVPEGLTVLNVPTPSVASGGPPAAGCPDTPAEAAGLFGGDVADWSINREVEGWLVIVVGSPITLSLPANMSVGYMVFADSLEMRSALGPATITNVNFAAIACGP